MDSDDERLAPGLAVEQWVLYRLVPNSRYGRCRWNEETSDMDMLPEDIDLPQVLLVNPDNLSQHYRLTWREDGMMLMDGEFYDVDVSAWAIADLLQEDDDGSVQ